MTTAQFAIENSNAMHAGGVLVSRIKTKRGVRKAYRKVFRAIRHLEACANYELAQAIKLDNAPPHDLRSARRSSRHMDAYHGFVFRARSLNIIASMLVAKLETYH